MNRRLNTISTLVVTVGLVTLSVMGGYLVHLRQQAVAAGPDAWAPQPGGVLILCGGGSVPDVVRDRFVQCAGGRDARIIVIPAYNPTPKEKAKLKEFWTRCGVAAVDVLSATSREEADTPAVAEAISKATAVWIGGGNQARLADTYVDTQVEDQLRALLERGGVVGGVSAGAAIMTRVMIAGGHDPVIEQPGFDLLPEAVIDQHFFRRNRTQRLLAVLARHPDLIGVGIDEHTAVVVQLRRKHWSVIGQSYVMVCLPTEDRFPRLEILKSGESTNIDVLKDLPGTTAIQSDTFLDAILGLDAGRSRPRRRHPGLVPAAMLRKNDGSYAARE